MLVAPGSPAREGTVVFCLALIFTQLCALLVFGFLPPPNCVCVLVVVDVDVDADVVVVVADVVRTAPLSGSSACHMFVFV